MNIIKELMFCRTAFGTIAKIGFLLAAFGSSISIAEVMPPPGFRALFDGKSLEGWEAKPRGPISHYPGAPVRRIMDPEQAEKAKENVGKWTIVDGAIVGEQDPPGSGLGAYLVSEEVFGDFELMFDIKPDWYTDTGVLLRTVPEGSPGLQVLVDHRPQGGIGGFYGNGLAGIHGMPFAVDAKLDANKIPIEIVSADPNAERVELSDRTLGLLDYAADVDDFLAVWKVNDWNTIKVRVIGRIPKVTTWVNGLKIAEIDTGKLDWPNYDAEECWGMLGREGHVSLEVHNSGGRDWLGKARWWPGAQVRWKNIYIKEL